EDGERLADGLSRDPQPGGEGILVQPFARRQTAAADRLEDRLVGLLDERRAGPQAVDARVAHDGRVPETRTRLARPLECSTCVDRCLHFCHTPHPAYEILCACASPARAPWR